MPAGHRAWFPIMLVFIIVIVIINHLEGSITVIMGRGFVSPVTGAGAGVIFGCHTEDALGPCHVAIFIGRSHEVATYFVKARSKRETGKTDIHLTQHNHGGDMPSLLPCFVNKKQVTGPSHPQGEGTTQEGECQEAGIMGP